MNLKVSVERVVQNPPSDSEFDYKVVRVSSKKKTALIYNHGDVYYNLAHRDPFASPEDCFFDLYPGEKA